MAVAFTTRPFNFALLPTSHFSFHFTPFLSEHACSGRFYLIHLISSFSTKNSSQPQVHTTPVTIYLLNSRNEAPHAQLPNLRRPHLQVQQRLLPPTPAIMRTSHRRVGAESQTAIQHTAEDRLGRIEDDCQRGTHLINYTKTRD